MGRRDPDQVLGRGKLAPWRGRAPASPRPSSKSEAPWYAADLAFACTRSGHCCTGESGTVLADDGELAALRVPLALDEAALREQCTRTLPSGRVVLREKANGECVFWSAREGCTVYALRPRQCRTWISQSSGPDTER